MLADRTARDIMRSDVLTITTETRAKEIETLLATRRISGLPVVDEAGQVVGIVSALDVLGKRPTTRAGTFMSSPVVSVNASATIIEIARLLTERRIKRVPVLGPDGKLLGIVTRADIVREVAELGG